MRSVITKEDVQSRSSEFLRERLVVSDLFKINEFSWVQSHHDRILLGGVALQNGKLEISTPEDFGVEYFLQRRELGLACLSGKVEISVDGKVFHLKPRTFSMLVGVQKLSRLKVTVISMDHQVFLMPRCPRVL